MKERRQDLQDGANFEVPLKDRETRMHLSKKTGGILFRRGQKVENRDIRRAQTIYLQLE